MVSWVIVAVIILAFVVFAKTTGFRYGKTMTNLIGAAIFFIVITFIFAITTGGYASELDSYDGFIAGMRHYAIWLNTFFTTSAGITGSAIEAVSQNVTGSN